MSPPTKVIADNSTPAITVRQNQILIESNKQPTHENPALVVRQIKIVVIAG